MQLPLSPFSSLSHRIIDWSQSIAVPFVPGGFFYRFRCKYSLAESGHFLMASEVRVFRGLGM